MSITSNSAPEGHFPPEPHAEGSVVPRWVLILFVVAFVLVAYLLYASHSERQLMTTEMDRANKQTQALAAQLDKTNSRLADLKGELDVTTQKLGLTQDELARARGLAQTIRKEQKQSDEQLRSQIGQVQQDTSTKFGEVTTALSGTKSDVEATKKDLEDTKTKLQSTIGDLGIQSGLIARNHEEVEALKRLGERNIYEFQLTKSKAPEKLGPIQLTLRKVDAKHFRYTVNVVADDKTIEKKDKTVGEPVQFYVHGVRVPYEIVVFDLGKDRASGYLSTPKDTNAAPAPASTPSSSSPSSPSSPSNPQH
jgi:septal ring factor EnvC (AmiA/AmiB activator)